MMPVIKPRQRAGLLFSCPLRFVTQSRKNKFLGQSAGIQFLAIDWQVVFDNKQG